MASRSAGLGRGESGKRRAFAVPLAVTLAFHAGLGGGLYAAGELIERGVKPTAPIEIEIITPPPPPPVPPPVIDEPPTEEEVAEPEPEPEPPPREPPQPRPRPAAEKPPPRAVPETAPAEVEPAPGESTSPEPPAPVVTLPGLTAGGGGPPAAVGTPTSRKVGTGGTGTARGGGGAADSTGTGGPRPVSIAAIKRRARPLNADLDTQNMYTPEAQRLGIEGEIKVALVVDETGKVVSRRLVTRLGYGLDERALARAAQIRFEPAIDTDDRPVADRVVWTFTFVLPR